MKFVLSILALLNLSTNCLSTATTVSAETFIEIQMLDEEPEKSPITNFDISDDLKLVVSSQSFLTNQIVVYNYEGDFLYGFSFEYDGKIGVEWKDNDRLTVYLIKSGKSITLDKNGVIEEVEIYDVKDYNDHFNHYVFSSKKQVGNTIYETEKSGSSAIYYSHNEIVRTDEAGNQEIIYRANSLSVWWKIFLGIGLSIFVVVVVIVVYKQTRKTRNSRIV